jgi:hypothetical protein
LCAGIAAHAEQLRQRALSSSLFGQTKSEEENGEQKKSNKAVKKKIWLPPGKGEGFFGQKNDQKKTSFFNNFLPFYTEFHRQNPSQKITFAAYARLPEGIE